MKTKTTMDTSAPIAADRVRLAVLAGVLIVLTSAGFLAGVERGRSHRQQDGPPERMEQRLGGYTFINPLIDCEVNGDPLQFRELRPFKDKIERVLRKHQIDRNPVFAAVYFRDLMNGPWFGINEQAQFTPASLLKVPVAMACMKQAERDPVLLQKQLVHDLKGDRNSRQLYKPARTLTAGASYSVEELIRRAITYSDNSASELLAKAVDQEVLLQTFRDLGVPAPRMNIQHDFLTVKRYASFLRVLYNASYLSKDSSQKLLEHLALSAFPDGLRAGVPSHVLVAHKFGEHHDASPGGLRQLHDCGIVYYPEHPYLLCIMARGSEFEPLVGLIQDVSRTVYGEIVRQFPAPASEVSP